MAKTGFVHRQPVVLRDLDGFGHVNNAVYLTYIENARVAFLADRVGPFPEPQAIGNVMATVTVTFHAPARYGDVMSVAVDCPTVGNSSFELIYELSAGDRQIASARSVQVMFDVATDLKRKVPDDWRMALQPASVQPEG
jgi:acyl-CoA thioester hydrolase